MGVKSREEGGSVTDSFWVEDAFAGFHNQALPVHS
jgi:hypothetical protein